MVCWSSQLGAATHLGCLRLEYSPLFIKEEGYSAYLRKTPDFWSRSLSHPLIWSVPPITDVQFLAEAKHKGQARARQGEEEYGAHGLEYSSGNQHKDFINMLPVYHPIIIM